MIAGGGFSGAELCGALQDFIERALRLYPTIDEREIRLVLAHPGPRILPEVSPELGEYAGEALIRRHDVHSGCTAPCNEPRKSWTEASEEVVNVRADRRSHHRPTVLFDPSSASRART